jgi:uncharacterized membrane protein YqjE
VSESRLSESTAGPFRRFAGSFLGLIHSHLGLFSVEVEETRERLLKSLALVVIGAGAILLCLLTLILAVVLMVDAEHRLYAVFGMLVFLLALAIACLGWVWRDLRSGSLPFEATLEELRRDRESLSP